MKLQSHSLRTWSLLYLPHSLTQVFLKQSALADSKLCPDEGPCTAKENIWEIWPPEAISSPGPQSLSVGKMQHRNKWTFPHCLGHSLACRCFLKVMRRKTVNQVVTWKINNQDPGERSCLSPQKNGLENHASLKSLESQWHPEDCIALNCITINVKFSSHSFKE